MHSIPDRSGWLHEPLASSPAEPPFPQLTAFERGALEAMAEHFGAEAAAFRRQIEACRVIDRVNTVVGFYTRVTMDRTALGPLDLNRKSAHLDVPGTCDGMMVMIGGEEGYLCDIEGATYGEDTMGGQKLAELSFTSFQLI